MYKLLVLCALAALGNARTIDFNGGKIVGGKPTAIQEVPYQVSLLTNGRHFCGGSILDENYIITAGHCAPYLVGGSVRAGSNVTYRGGSVHKVVWVKRHENYSNSFMGTPTNDIAVARVSPPFNIDETRTPVALYYSNEEIPGGRIALISGYGTTGEQGPLSRVLMSVKVPIVSRKHCDDIYTGLGLSGVGPDFICAGTTEGGKDSCQGDSGGPVVINGELVGIVSYGLGCARPGIPGVYTNVAYFSKWIFQNTQF